MNPQGENRPLRVFLATFLSFFLGAFRCVSSVFCADLMQEGNQMNPEGDNRLLRVFLATLSNFHFSRTVEMPIRGSKQAFWPQIPITWTQKGKPIFANPSSYVFKSSICLSTVVHFLVFTGHACDYCLTISGHFLFASLTTVGRHHGKPVFARYPQKRPGAAA